MGSGPTECYKNIPEGSVWTSLVIYFFLICFRRTRNMFNLNQLMTVRVKWPNTGNGDLPLGEHLTASQCPKVTQTGNYPKVIALGCILLSWLMMKGHPFVQRGEGACVLVYAVAPAPACSSSCLCPPVPATALGHEVTWTTDFVFVTCTLTAFAVWLTAAVMGRVWGSKWHIPPTLERC